MVPLVEQVTSRNSSSEVSPPKVQDCKTSAPDMQDHLLQPLNEFGDRLFWDDTTDFISSQRRCLFDGWPAATVFGSAETDLESVFGVHKFPTPPSTAVRWVANLLQPFDELGVPERLGLMLLFGHFIRVSSNTTEFERRAQVDNHTAVAYLTVQGNIPEDP